MSVITLSVENQCCRQLRVLWFTLLRECCKCQVGYESRDEKSNKVEDGEWNSNIQYLDEKLNKEESNGTFLSAISALMEDAPEIVLVVYHIALGIQLDSWG